MRSLDDEVLRSLGHVRTHIDAGDGTETVVHALAHRGFGALSRRLRAVLGRLQSGVELNQALKQELEVARTRKTERGYALLLGALMSEGVDLDERLLNISNEVTTESRNRVIDHAKRVGLLSYLALILSMLTVFVPIAHIMIDAINSAELMEPIVIDDGEIYGPVFMIISLLMAIMTRR